MEQRSEGVLIVTTASLLLAIDPAKLSNGQPVEDPSLLLATDPASLSISQPVEDDDLEESEMLPPPPPPPVFKKINLVKEGFPYGMRCFVRESKLHMVGGEKLFTEVDVESLRRRRSDFVDRSFGTNGISPYIYVSDLTTPDSVAELRQLPITMISPKPNPFIAEVEGKIYVLHGAPFFHHGDNLLFPTFEEYDPRGDNWTALPDPPFHNPNRWYFAGIVAVHSMYASAAENTIYVKTRDHDYSYNVNSKVWDRIGSSVLIPPSHLPMARLFQLGKFVPDYDDVFIGMHNDSLYAALIPGDGSPPTHQILIEVWEEFYKNSILSRSGAVIAMRGKEMCVVKPCIWKGLHPTIYITTFLVEKLLHSSAEPPPPKRAKTTAASEPVQDSDQPAPVHQPAPFLSVTCLTKGFYGLDDWGVRNPDIGSAFFQSWE